LRRLPLGRIALGLAFLFVFFGTTKPAGWSTFRVLQLVSGAALLVVLGMMLMRRLRRRGEGTKAGRKADA
jgi:uncharacterized oligopeptide transporter (OPT) family protein